MPEEAEEEKKPAKAKAKAKAGLRISEDVQQMLETGCTLSGGSPGGGQSVHVNAGRELVDLRILDPIGSGCWKSKGKSQGPETYRWEGEEVHRPPALSLQVFMREVHTGIHKEVHHPAAHMFQGKGGSQPTSSMAARSDFVAGGRAWRVGLRFIKGWFSVYLRLV